MPKYRDGGPLSKKDAADCHFTDCPFSISPFPILTVLLRLSLFVFFEADEW